MTTRGSGFDAEDHDIRLNIYSPNQDPLKADKDYLITKDSDGDGIILKLLGNRRWADLEDRTPPVALILDKVYFASDDSKNLLIEPVIVAQILDTPSVDEHMNNVIYQTASNELRITGTGFIGAKKVDLYFQPPLVKEVAYEDVSHYPLAKDEIVLRVRHGYQWRETPGALLVVGIDTGGGPVKLNGDDGVQVAEVTENLDEHSVYVDDDDDNDNEGNVGDGNNDDNNDNDYNNDNANNDDIEDEQHQLESAGLTHTLHILALVVGCLAVIIILQCSVILSLRYPTQIHSLQKKACR